MKTKILVLLALVFFGVLGCAAGVFPNATVAPACKYPAGTVVVAYNSATQTFSLVQNGQVVATAKLVSGTLNFGAYGTYGVTYHSYAGGKKLDKTTPWGWYKVGSVPPIASGRIYVGACK